ncbi:tuliposide A-converting enzyme 1, chloroplastic-like [Phragmites australis]|uniref:tuliposide A-converting enzyme 1, chloroplastic-like n=1 Tax=Phragmites australis TaxID=29695 RepID=UPI002D7663F9|nr:tuliposide A-converting enzyme 1, chloroplastic-like [Phragmites australis]
MAGTDADTEVQVEFFPIIRQYKSGRVERFMNQDPLPAGTDPVTGVVSKDVVVDPATGLWARLFLPPGSDGKKLPVVVYYHGGAYVIGSAADPFTHNYLNALVAEAGVLAVALEYRLAPEHSLPAAYDDSWEGLKWVASHAAGGGEGSEPWLIEHGDFSRVFLAGASAGGTIAHVMAVRAREQGLRLPIKGLLVVHPYFSGAADIGNEGTTGKVAKARADAFWRFLYPGSPGLDDPLSNPFSEAAGGSAARVAAERVLVCVAEKDDLRDRGVWYYESLKASGYPGEVELLESMGQGHVFYCINPRCDKAREMQERILSFLRK